MILNKVTEFRERKGVSKAHLSRRVGVSRSYITKLESNRLQPSGEIMFRIAGYLECDVGALFQWAADASAKSQILVSPVQRERKQTDKSLVNPTAKAVASPVAQ